DAIFGPVCVVRMTGAELVLDIRIVLTPLIDVVDDERDRCPRGDLSAVVVREHTGDDPHRVRLAPLRREARLPRPAPVEKDLDVSLRQRNARRTTVHHAADRGTVTLSPRCNAQEMSECVV